MPPKPGPPPAPLAHLSDEARAFAAAALSPNTQRAYRSQWRLWVEHARTLKIPALPADPTDVANWLASRAAPLAQSGDIHPPRQLKLAHHGPTNSRESEARDSRNRDDLKGSEYRSDSRVPGCSVATLRTAVAALRFAHVAAGYTFDRTSPPLALVLRGVTRSRLHASKQARPLTSATVASLLSVLSHTPRDCRDAALLALGYCFARRRSELTGLDLEQLGDGTGVLSLSGPNLEVRLYHSKSHQLPADEVYVVPKDNNRLAVDAITRWIETAHILPGEPLLRRVFASGRVSQSRLDPQSVALIIKQRLKRYYEDQGVSSEAAEAKARGFSGHSLRVGFAVASAEAGASVLAIQKALGHKSPAMAARYAQAAEKARMSPHLLPGVALDRPTRGRRKRRRT